MSSAIFGMNLLMFVSCKDRLRISSEPSGMGSHSMDFNFSGSIFIPSIVTTYPKRLPSSIPKEGVHILGTDFIKACIVHLYLPSIDPLLDGLKLMASSYELLVWPKGMPVADAP
nr:hypothetical protein [Tanacetum cinerariifolium]